MSKNIRDNGGSIPGIRPGEPTSRYIGKIINRIVLLGALLLSVVALFPIVFSQITSAILVKFDYSQGMNISLGGTSIIILVGVALETVKQLESQMMMRHYKGFLDYTEIRFPRIPYIFSIGSWARSIRSPSK